jgi:DNA-directed RNA polymerase specialized sigma24 family protein
MLEVPDGTVASRLFRARRALRDAMVAAHPVARREGA